MPIARSLNRSSRLFTGQLSNRLSTIAQQLGMVNMLASHSHAAVVFKSSMDTDIVA